MLDDIVQVVKRKKELSALDDSFVWEKVKRVLEKEKKIKKKLEKATSFREFSRSSEFKELKRRVREELRTVYGVFQKASKGRSPAERLASHQSSEERLAEYEEIYKRIFEITGKPGSILDLGCGANPYSYDFLGCRPTYLAMDLPSDNMKEIADYFKKEAIEGEAFGIDLVKEYEKLGKLLDKHPVDMAFLFKLLDSLESIKRHISEKLLDAINATWLVVSFPTVSIGGGKHIKKERRAWFEKLLARRRWYYETFSISNEVFYVVLKNPDRLADIRYGRRTGEDLLNYEQYDLTAYGKELKKLTTGKVLDLGCGIGRDVKMLSEIGFETTGIERAEKLVAVAKKKAPEATVIQGDIRSLPFENETFDAVWSIASIVHLYDNEAVTVLKEVWRVLKKEGILLINVKEGRPKLAERQEVKLYFRRYSEREITTLLEKVGFKILKTAIVERQKNREGRKGNFIMLWAQKSI